MLLAVRLLNHAVDVKWAKNSCCALIIIDDNAITPRRDMARDPASELSIRAHQMSGQRMVRTERGASVL